MTQDSTQTGKPATPSEGDAEAAAKSATNEAERHKTGEMPAKAGKVKPTA
ncbi:hypothetical protein [Aureimonas sp. Leaf454]|nr:hypothetical protein [Aureimonas sp. Leaf454]